MLEPQTLVNNRYRVLRLVGAGGMGSVYAAQDERLGRSVALKLLRADLATDPKARDRFVREAQIAAQLLHPNIVRTYDVGDAPTGPFLVQELLDGRTLDTLLPLPPAQARTVIRAVADALGYIHAHGYVHCDIKPQNIMLLGDPAQPRVVLLDFGIARVAGTDTTTLIATPHYLAPERILGAAPTPASDLYALGIVFYEAITGKPPFDAPNIHAIMEQHRTRAVPPLNLGTPDSDAFDRIIRKLAAKQPVDRYASAAALLHDLDTLAAGPSHAQPTLVVERPALAAPKRIAPPAPVAAVAGSTTHKRIGLAYLVFPLIIGVLLLGGLLTRPRTADTGNAIAPPAPPTISAPSAPATVNVPAVIGLPVEEARQQIEAAGLTVVLRDAITSDQPPNTVIGTDPGPNQPLAPSSQVFVQPSSGPPPPTAAPAQADGNNGKGKGKNEGKDKGKGKDKDD